MKLIDRYLLKQFLKNFLTVNVAFSAIYLLVDFIEKFDNFSRAGKSFGLALKYFILNIPFVVDQLGPVLILLAGVTTLGILNHTNELTALKAGGIPLKKIVQPFLIGATLLTLLMLAASQWLLPVTNTMTNNIWYEQVKGKLPLGIYRNGRYYYRGGDGFYSFEWPDPKRYLFVNFSYSRWSDSYSVDGLLTARYAKWDTERKRWILNHAQGQKRNENGSYNVHNQSYWQVPLPEDPEDFLVLENDSAQQSITDLYREIFRQNSDTLKRQAITDFLGRISYILLGIPLIFLGLPILLISYQKWGRDLSVAIPASCGIAFVAWGAWGAMQSLAVTGYLHPFVSAITIHIIFATVGIILLRKQDR